MATLANSYIHQLESDCKQIGGEFIGQAKESGEIRFFENQYHLVLDFLRSNGFELSREFEGLAQYWTNSAVRAILWIEHRATKDMVSISFQSIAK